MDDFRTNEVSENQIADEYTSTADSVVAAENEAASEFDTVAENLDAPKVDVNASINKEKKDRALASLSGGMVATIAAVTVGITSMLNVNMSAVFNKVEYEDCKISYEVAVEDMTSDEKLTAYLVCGDETLDEVNLTDEDGDGIIEGTIELDRTVLADKLSESNGEPVNYRLNLKGMVGLDLERDFDSYVIQIEGMISAFNNVEGECHCSKDGCYHFSMDFTDDNGLFTDFEARIEDSFGNAAYCTFTDNLHDEQKIFIGNLKGSQATLIITYKADGEPKTISVETKI